MLLALQTEDIYKDLKKYSPQYKNEKFVNYKQGPEWNFSDILPTAWDFLVTGNNRKPAVELPVKLGVKNDNYIEIWHEQNFG